MGGTVRIVFKIEAPLAEHVFGMGIGRRKKAFNPDASIYFRGKADELTPMHLLAGIFTEISA